MRSSPRSCAPKVRPRPPPCAPRARPRPSVRSSSPSTPATRTRSSSPTSTSRCSRRSPRATPTSSGSCPARSATPSRASAAPSATSATWAAVRAAEATQGGSTRTPREAVDHRLTRLLSEPRAPEGPRSRVRSRGTGTACWGASNATSRTATAKRTDRRTPNPSHPHGRYAAGCAKPLRQRLEARPAPEHSSIASAGDGSNGCRSSGIPACSGVRAALRWLSSAHEATVFSQVS